MDQAMKEELVPAVKLLLGSTNAKDLYQTMLNAAPLIARHKDVRLTGEAECLNILAVVKFSHPSVYAGVIDLIERRRAEAELEPLDTPAEEKFNKSEYMQQFMEQKRVRQRRAADIENMQRSERDKLVGRSRLDFMQNQSAIWKKERDAFLEKVKDAAAPTRLKKEDIAAAVDQFWAKVDASLDKLEDAARRGKQITRSVSAADIDAILSVDPYRK
jgi:hypothetical protein